MIKKYALYNPHADNENGKKDADTVKGMYENTVMQDMCLISDYQEFFDGLEPDAHVIICGGDGTLNRFVNLIRGKTVRNPLYYFATGTGNDFARDLGHSKHDAPEYRIEKYLRELPSVTVNGKTDLFINNVGFGIDGYCCEVGDILREKNKRENTEKPINYTMIAIKGLLFKFKPRCATVRVDGKEHTYKKVWLAPTMNGRYYGGGMMPTPAQDRLGEDRSVSLMVFHGTGKLRTLMIFPSLFKGEHVKHTKNVAIHTGHDISVTFDSPAPLQIDGETVLGVTSYRVKTAALLKAEAEKSEAQA